MPSKRARNSATYNSSNSNSGDSNSNNSNSARGNKASYMMLTFVQVSRGGMGHFEYAIAGSTWKMEIDVSQPRSATIYKFVVSSHRHSEVCYLHSFNEDVAHHTVDVRIRMSTAKNSAKFKVLQVGHLPVVNDPSEFSQTTEGQSDWSRGEDQSDQSDQSGGGKRKAMVTKPLLVKQLLVKDLRKKARALKMVGFSSMNKAQLISLLLKRPTR